MNRHAVQDVRLPQPCKRGPARWIIPSAVGLTAGVLGIVLGSASTAEGSNTECAAIADEYAALVSDGLDAGLSGDEGQMLDIAARRDALGERVKNYC